MQGALLVGLQPTIIASRASPRPRSLSKAQRIVDARRLSSVLLARVPEIVWPAAAKRARRGSCLSQLLVSFWDFCLRQNAQRAALRAAGRQTRQLLASNCRPTCQTSMTRMCARLEIQTGRLAVASRRARAVRAKCRLAGLTTAPQGTQLPPHREHIFNEMSLNVKMGRNVRQCFA